ncbi:MAG TPA: transglutaminase-like cysteine peptidase [Rhizorhapis sp.]|nr:transglutaminase-like cysteine peptidase [Rhizorhapis sp.]
MAAIVMGLAPAALAAPCNTAFGGVQPAAGTSATFTKSEAILQGATSRLEQTRLRQAEQGQPAATAALAIPLQADCPEASSKPAIYTESGSIFAKDPIRPGQPDVFGSVALPVSRTALDQKWKNAAAGTLPATGPWAALIVQSRSLDRLEQIRAVNRWVNARISYVEDARLYGAADHWAPAVQSLSRGRGDCEDYAIAKMQILRTMGVPANAMFLVIARDLVRRADHAILAVAVDGDLLVLDNETDRVLSTSQVRDYRPVLTFNANGRWTHGYRTAPPADSVRYAALNR